MGAGERQVTDWRGLRVGCWQARVGWLERLMVVQEVGCWEEGKGML